MAKKAGPAGPVTISSSCGECRAGPVQSVQLDLTARTSCDTIGVGLNKEVFMTMKEVLDRLESIIVCQLLVDEEYDHYDIESIFSQLEELGIINSDVITE